MSFPIPVVSSSPPSQSFSLSISPSALSALHRFQRSEPPPPLVPPRVLRPLATDEFRILLLENISQNAVDAFRSHGYQVDWFPKAWSEEELVQKIGAYHAIGIRSKTRITEKVLAAASKVSSNHGFLTRHSSR
jgi:D-3-phosphoglycerate dehydrogenase / 2-oxoglutarate reductase